MRLTSFTDFAIRALMRLSGEPTRSFATAKSRPSSASPAIIWPRWCGIIADGGFISTQRGVGGGFTLAQPPQSITLGEIVRTLEGGHPLVECFRDDGGSCVLTPRCRLRAKLASAREAFMRELDATTLAECAYPPRAKKGSGPAAPA